jgi:hypothetical protein
MRASSIRAVAHYAVREHYEISDDDNWVYQLDVSNDGGKNWNEGQTEITLHRSK